MTRQITIDLPDDVYAGIERAAAAVARPVDAVIREAVIALAPITADNDIADSRNVTQMVYLNDDALWHVARLMLSDEQRERLHDLHDRQQERGLSDDERIEQAALLDVFHRALVVRAQAAVVLKARGYDIDELLYAPVVT